MDKVLLGALDIESLFKWRDAHKSEVRSNPIPMRDLEIICKDSGVKIKCIREPERLRMWINIDGKSQGHVEFALLDNGMWNAGKDKTQLDKDAIQSCLSLYASVIALMVYGERKHTQTDGRKKSHEGSRSQKKHSGSYTYILHRGGVSVYVGRCGEHASPKGEFSVRGHYRHYKSGKIIWINEYRKGEGKRDGKEYRLRKKDAESLQQ